MTVSLSHPINLEGLQASIAALKGEQMCRKELELCLYFVVPPERFDEFKIQKLVSKGNKDLGVTIRQFALKIDLEPVNKMYPDWKFEGVSLKEEEIDPKRKSKVKRRGKQKSKGLADREEKASLLPSSSNAVESTGEENVEASTPRLPRSRKAEGGDQDSAGIARALGSAQPPRKSSSFLPPRIYCRSSTQKFLRPSAGFKI